MFTPPPAHSIAAPMLDASAAELLFENMPNGAALCQLVFHEGLPVDFICLRTNHDFLTHTGMELQGRRGTSLLAGFSQEDRSLLEACARVGLGGGGEQQRLFFTGVGRWFELSILSLLPGHFVLVFKPVHEQQAGRSTSGKHSHFWHAALAAISDAVFVCDRDGRLVEMNDAFVRFYRLQQREEFPRDAADYSRLVQLRTPGGEYVPPTQWPVRRALRGEQGASVRFHLLRQDTGESWVGSYDFGPIRNNEGIIIGALLIARDVTGQAAQEKALQHAGNELAEMKRALAALDMAVYRLEARHGYIVEADALMLERLGYSLDELRRLAPWELDGSVTRENTPALLAAIQHNGSLRAEGLHQTRDGRQIPVDVLLYHQPASEGPGSLLAFARDITARRRREAALEQLRQENHRLAESTVASLTASAIAHELNQPLMVTSLSAATALRLLDAGPDTEAQLRESLLATHRGAEKASDVVRELVGFLHKRPVRRETLDLCALVRKVARRFQAGLASEEQLLTRIGAEALWVMGNRMQLEKVLANLIQNGFDAMSQRAAPRKLLVRVRREPGDAAARVSVLDHGTGMEPKQLRRVFEPFYTTKPTGLGMGLAVCQAVVQEHKGSIWARSRPGRGAVFHIRLLLATAGVA